MLGYTVHPGPLLPQSFRLHSCTGNRMVLTGLESSTVLALHRLSKVLFKGQAMWDQMSFRGEQNPLTSTFLGDAEGRPCNRAFQAQGDQGKHLISVGLLPHL